MRNRYAMLAAAAGLAVVFAGAGLVPAQAASGTLQRAGDAGGTWGKAMAVPGIGALNTGKMAELDEVSCPAAGDCTAAGSYSTAGARTQGLIVSEHDGVWAKAMAVPGLVSLNVDGEAEVDSLSCAAPGDCSAGGQYYDKHDEGQAFVVNERDGVWGKAIEVPGSAALNVTGGADVGAMSCSKPGDCTAGGEYGNYGAAEGPSAAMVVTEHNWVWGDAIEVPGSGKLNVLGQANVDSVSCAKPGDCSAGGSYYDANGNYQAFVATQSNGDWGKAIEVPGSGALNSGGIAGISSVSCAAPGDCSAGGSYSPASGPGGALVVTEVNGRWGKAIEVPGSGRLNTGDEDEVVSVSCTRPGYCSAGGDYTAANTKGQAFVVTQWRGRWGMAVEVRGSAHLNAGGDAEVYAVSCTAPGDCSAGGTYTDKRGKSQGFVVSESDKWGTAIAIPGLVRLNIGGNAEVSDISCARTDHCTAVGSYASSRDGINSQGFLVTEK
jgi:hypothetical protein